MSKIDYEKLTEITVKNQKELDEIPQNFKGRIYIEELETKKQKLIEKLEKDIKENNFKETECLEDKGRYYHAQEVLKILKGEDNA